MSDDEEIICKGKDLYTHLINQGYSDFQTFIPTSESESLEPSQIALSKTHGTNIGNQLNNRSKQSIVISSNDYKQLDIIIKSKLLYKEDIDLIESELESCFIYKAKSKCFWYISTLASFASSLALCRKDVKFVLPCGFTVMLAFYSLWNSYKETIEVQNRKKLRCHLNLLQSLCSDVQKLLRFLKETEILSIGEVKPQNICSAIYSPVISGVDQIKELNTGLPSWKTLPHIRKCLFDSLIDVIDIFVFACDVLHQTASTDTGDSGSTNDIRVSLFHTRTDPDKSILFKELQVLDETYLALQSKYLKLISFSLCPELFNSYPKFKNSTSKVYKLCQSLESKLSNISFRLKMHYNLHNIYSSKNRSVGTRLLKVDNEMSRPRIQVEVHNIFLLMLSMLLRVRGVEDYLEHIPSVSENQNEIEASVFKQLATLKYDLASTLKCFDLIHQQVDNGFKNHDVQSRSEKINEDNISGTTKTTGIVVGASDFNVNSPDEVFLAISGLNNEEQELIDDDWTFEKKPQIPMNLLSELSNRLKIRKQFCNEREKAALERQGLTDFPEISRLGGREETDGNLSTRKYPDTERVLDVNDYLDDKERIVYKTPYQEMKQNRRHPIDSDSDNSVTDDERTLKDDCPGNLPEINRVSLANQAAMKSLLWGNTSEEFFSDG